MVKSALPCYAAPRSRAPAAHTLQQGYGAKMATPRGTQQLIFAIANDLLQCKANTCLHLPRKNGMMTQT